jgi:hypothetical protein
MLLRGTVKDGERRDPIANDFREILFSGLDGLAAARDLPDVILSIGSDYILASEKRPRNGFASFSMGVERYFGIKDARSHGCFPASAFRGPWINLLRYHPRQTLDFFIRVFNHCADWYARPRFNDPLEPAWRSNLLSLMDQHGNTGAIHDSGTCTAGSRSAHMFFSPC